MTDALMIPLRLLLIFAFSFVAVWPTATRAEAEAAHAPFDAEAGKTVRYRVERTNVDEAEGEPPRVRSKDITEYTFAVMGSVGKGHRISLTYKSPQGALLGLESSEMDPATQAAIVKEMQNLNIVYLDDAFGAPETIENLADTRAWFDRIFTQMTDGMSATLPADRRQGYRDMMDRMINVYRGMSDEQFTQTILKDVFVLFSLVGAKIVPGQEVAFDDPMPSPVGGPPINSKKRVWVSDVDDRQITINMHSVVDREGAKATAKAMIEAITAQQGGQMAESARKAIEMLENLDMSDTFKTVLRRSDGWPESMSMERRIASGPQARVQTYVFTRLD